MTTHKTLIHAKCPLNGEWDYYDVIVETYTFLAAERFQEACNCVRGCEMTQEAITAQLHRILSIAVKVEGRHGQNTETACTMP